MIFLRGRKHEQHTVFGLPSAQTRLKVGHADLLSCPPDFPFISVIREYRDVFEIVPCKTDFVNKCTAFIGQTAKTAALKIVPVSCDVCLALFYQIVVLSAANKAVHEILSPC
jgi:hypothetical protein